MTNDELQTLKISSQATFNKMVRFGWIDPLGREISWDRFTCRRGPEVLGRVGSSYVFVPLPAAETDGEKSESRQLAASGKEFRTGKYRQ